MNIIARKKKVTSIFPNESGRVWRTGLIVFFLVLMQSWAATSLFAAGQKGLVRDFDFIVSATQARTPDFRAHEHTPREISPIGFAALGVITLYQNTISSQDKSVCNFSPSCSHFGAEAIRRAGFFRGTLMALDRILRCNPYSRGSYKFNSRTGKSIDPVDDYLDGAH